MEPKLPEDIYKTHLENTRKCHRIKKSTAT